MANPGPETRNAAHRKNNSVKLWDLICCRSPSTTSPIEAAPHSSELEPGPRIGERDYSDVIDTADSIVSFVLNAVQSIGSGLPGIGVVSVVLSAKDKCMTERANRKEMDKILKYIEELCEDAGTSEGMETPVIDMQNARFIENIRGDFGNQEKSKGWQRALDIINADSRKEDLKAVWEGVERAMKRRGLAANIDAARMVENVYQRMLEINRALDAVRSDLLNQMTKDEEKAMDDLLSRLKIAEGAKFNSMRTEQTRLVTCTSDTRVEVLKTIENWAVCEDDRREHLFWLNGLAGTGKSTIASTIAKWANEENLLGGSFFFSRGVPELSGTALVFPTLASQLAEFDKEYKCALYHVLKGDRFAVTANLQVQFDVFIRKPFAACRKRRSILVMLDALDECSPEVDVQEMLCLLLKYEATESGETDLRIFVTSRPESHIRSVFTSREGAGRHEKVILHDIDTSTVRNDIRTYLKAETEKLSSDDSKLERKPPKGWLSPSDFEKVLNKCGEFFAYAATVVRFIGDTGIGDPVSQLAEILRLMENPSMTANTNPYHTLDSLYLAVLEQAVSKDSRAGSVARIVHVIATIISLRRPMGVRELALFLGMTSDDVQYTLRHLHSVILVPADRDYVQFFHQSFPDFLEDQRRCPSDKDFLFDIAEHERFMASRCIDLNSLHGVARYGVMLPYAAQHWMSHFRAGIHSDIVVPPEKGSLWPVTTGNELTEEIARLEREPQAESDKPWSERTRSSVLDTVRGWITGRDEEQKHLFWLYGWADRGCPDIAMYITKWARDERIPGACISFNCMYLGTESIFPFLASQLARLNPDYRRTLYNVIQRDEGKLVSGDFRMQFETLICRPMARSTRREKSIQQPILLVLNACESGAPELQEYKYEFLWNLLHHFTSSLGLRVLVVSKPTSTFRALLKPRVREPPVISYDFDEHMDCDDIRTFLERRLRKHEEALSDEQLETLLDYCGTSFTFATTALRFIFDKEIGDPNGQLHAILAINEKLHTTADDSRPIFDLDNLYRLVLQQVASKNPLEGDIERIRCFIATIICLRRSVEDFLTSDTLEHILSMEEDDIRTIRRQLRCVEGDTEDNLYGSLHSSFKEFIQDKTRCTDSRFLVDAPAHEWFIALQCCRNLQAGKRRSMSGGAYYYLIAHWPSHLRLAIYHHLDGDLVQKPGLRELLRDKDVLARSYDFQGETTKILLGEDVDIIRFLRELVEKYQPKESETILTLLRDAEADEEVARCREEYLIRRRELVGERASHDQTGSGVQDEL